MDDLILVHEVPGRLRFRSPMLGVPELDPAWMESWVEALAGVRSARVNRPARSMVVEFKGGDAMRGAVIQRLRAFSLDAQPSGYPAENREAEIAPMVTTIGTLAILPFLTPPMRLLLTVVNVGSTLLKGADTLLHKGVKMEVLDALAVGLAAAGGEVYTANLTNFMLDLGEYLERKTERQSDRLLRNLLRPEHAMAWVERGGELVQIPGNEVRKSEAVVIGVGETIPVDGRVVDGKALVNQASVTGENVPVRKEAPHRVLSGTVIEEGRLRIEAVQVGDDTTTARISRFIEDSLGKRSRTQRIAEELADKRVWLTLGTGGLVYLLTRNLTRLEAVFLVDYSCALKLGTPVAFKSSMFHAASNGILMKGGEAVENLAGVDTVVFDKTGTLTYSQLIVTDVEVLKEDGGCTEANLLALVASVEEHASHPVAEAVVEAARERDLKHISHGEVDYLVAHGLSAEVQGEQIVMGSRHFLEEHKQISFHECEAVIHRLEDEGKSLLYVGNSKGPIGLIALQDTLREETPDVLKRLRHLGVKSLVMITGDRKQKAEALGRALGFDEVYGEMAPGEKAGVVERMQKAGRKVAFVGDGVNDGPALVSAEVGIGMPQGADLARATADIVLLQDDLQTIADAREIAQKTMKLIRDNFNLAVGINTAILGGAILGLFSPVASAVLHNGTTIGILLKSLAGVRPSREAPPDLARALKQRKRTVGPLQSGGGMEKGNRKPGDSGFS